MSDKKNIRSRRDFLKTTGLITTGALLSGGLAPRVHAAENNTIKVALVGCGGRGTGAAANALSTQKQGPIKLWALADAFEHKVNNSFQQLSDGFEGQVEVGDRKFVGLDAYKKAIDTLGPGDLVMFGTPPAFRPFHVEYAIEKGINIFMEKSFCVDGPGYRKIKACGEKATQKNLKVAGGLMTRHDPGVEECIKRIHDGEIGEVITSWVYRVHGPFPCGARGNMSPLHHQLQNFNCFTWLCGSFALDWMIHNLDAACWARNEWPVSCQGQGGRQVRTSQDQMFDHCAYEYSFADGSQMMVQLRQQENTWGFFGAVINGTKGTAVLGEGQENVSRIVKDRNWKVGFAKPENLVWQYGGDKLNKYQVEIDRLVAAIRADKPYNETSRCADAAMVGIVGRMATESGKQILWNDVVNSDVPLTPDLEKLDLNGPSPVMPDENGNYEIAKPGITEPR
ncbi:MAG: twin-arginine translocation signal domain-containing protein [Planctomycetaceae bacterium]|nr:twin-arginine translocation signal domain-containing protein [Planctomycetaceae bacterium]